MTYLWACAALPLPSIKPTRLTQLFVLFYHPHTLMLRTLLWLASIQRHKADLQWSIDRCVEQRFLPPGDTVLFFSWLLTSSPAAGFGPWGFCSIMSQVFCIWRESMQTTADDIKMIMLILKPQMFMFAVHLAYSIFSFLKNKTKHIFWKTLRPRFPHF